MTIYRSTWSFVVLSQHPLPRGEKRRAVVALHPETSPG